MLRTLAVLAVLAPTSALAAPIVVMPGDDFCAAFNAAAAGDEILLAPGDHAGPCALTSGGAPGSPKQLRSADPADPATIVYVGDSSNVLDVLTSHVTIADLQLGPTGPGIDAIKLKDGGDLRVEGCTFTQVGGISIAANSKDSDRVEIVGNRFLDLKATGIYLGCHDGLAVCSAREVLIAGNLIDGVDSDAVGYGLEVKLDSFGVVRDNVIHDTKGPGIEIYGSTDLARRTLVEGNLVIRSRNNPAVEIAGGPTLVQNNIVVGGESGGLSVYDYQNRDLVRDIQVIANTLVADVGPPVTLSKWAADKQLEFSGNAVGAPGAAPIAGVAMIGNVTCEDPAACWLDVAALDFWPSDGSPLLTGAAPELAAAPTIDFCGQTRGAVPQVGALERSLSEGPGPLAITLKGEFACPTGEGETTGDDTDSETSGSSGANDTSTGEANDTSTGNDADADSGPDTPTSGAQGSESGVTTSDLTSSDPDLDLDDPNAGGCGCDAPGGPQGALLALLLLLRRRRAMAFAAAPAAERRLVCGVGIRSPRS